MPKMTQSGKQWETPQVIADQLATETYGGMAPDKKDIIRSANARGTKRHEMKNQPFADLEVLPDSAEPMGNEMVGIRDSGYLAKKNLEYGPNAFYNSLPPGMDIEDQENCDIRKEEMVVYAGGLGYPGDGWVARPRGGQMPRTKDMGRESKTNYVGSRGVDPMNPRGN